MMKDYFNVNISQIKTTNPNPNPFSNLKEISEASWNDWPNRADENGFTQIKRNRTTQLHVKSQNQSVEFM